MIELPLFPLNTVIFPSTPITLHIFEERYKVMFNRCIEKQEPFGVVLIKYGMESLGPLAEPHPIGCTARITFVERLTQGRMNVIAVGGERFHIRSLNYDQDYLVGNVDIFPLDYEKPGDLLLASHELRPWVKRYLQILIDANMVQANVKRLPNDPLEFAYLSAFLLQTPSSQKQALLEIDQGTQLMEEIRNIYRREVTLLKNLIAVEEPGESNEPSLN
jgi:Lon protease-like protein